MEAKQIEMERAFMAFAMGLESKEAEKGKLEAIKRGIRNARKERGN